MPRPAGAFIRKRRQALDIEAKELAPRVGIEPGTLLNIENGHNTASTRLLHRIASELGGANGSAPGHDSSTDSLLRRYRRLRSPG